MAHEVFISHSSQDKTIADAVCAALENSAIRCWIAPRDVQPGRSFAGEITRAIQRSKVMVLIFSAHSNTSEQVLREVQLAANSHLHILQFRIEDVIPNDDLEYYLSTPHWLDALTPPLENHLQRLGKSIKGLLEISTEEPETGVMSPHASPVESRTAKRDQDRVTAAKDITVPVQSNQTTRSQIAIPPVAPAPPGRITSKTKRALWITATAFFLGIAIVAFLLFRRAPTQTASSSSPATVTEKPPLPEPTGNPPPSADVLFSDSFRRADTNQWGVGQGDMAFGGRARFFYLPIFGGANPTGAVTQAGALENNGRDFGGVQFATSLAERGANLGQDLNIRCDLLVPTNAAGDVTQAGPYFRSRAAAAGDGIFGGTSAGYWVALYGTGEVKVRVMNGRPDDPFVATSGTPRSFDTQRFHTLEIAASGSTLQVSLDGYLLTFEQNGQLVTTVDIPPFWDGPPAVGANDGTAGLCFGAENNRGKIGGQRAKNLVVTTFHPLAALPVQHNQSVSSPSSPAAPIRISFVPQLKIKPETSLREAGLKVRSATGPLSITNATPNMVVGHGRAAVMIMEGGPMTSIEFDLDRSARKIFLERIGTSQGASVPTWRLEALDKSGQVLDSFGEEHGLPADARTVELRGQGIVTVRLSTDNRFGTGTWATWSCLPISELGWEE